MNDAELYAKSNSFQRVISLKVFEEFAHLLQWQEDGSDSILDVGCGSGDVTMDLILPQLPSNFRRLIGCDISDEMIKYAQQHYGHPNVIFDQLDIGGSVDEFLNKFGTSDHIVSFFCLHWVQNQKAAMKNITKLLTPNGDCLLLFVISCDIFKVFNEMAKGSQWSQYMKDVNRFTSPYLDSVNPTDDLRVLLQSVGFTCCDIQTREVSHTYNNYVEFVSKSRYDF